VLPGLLAILAAFTSLKIGSLQLEDLALLLLLGFCIAKTTCMGFSFRIDSRLATLAKSYGWFLLLLVLLSFNSFRLAYFPLDDPSLVKQPVIFSLSKLLQLAAIICGFLWLSNVFLHRIDLLKAATTGYWWAGIATSWYALLSYAAVAVGHFTAPTLFGAYATDGGGIRARGLFIEGGPFGVYVVSVFVVALLRRHLTGRRLGLVNIAILLASLFLSGSKAGFLGAAALGFYAALSATSARMRGFAIIFAAGVIAVAAWGMQIGNRLNDVLVSYQNLEQFAEEGTDYNVVLGRISASYIVPQMVLAHPLAGIGFGNYPLMRNDPHYLGPLPAITDMEDLPGLGFPGVAAEMGIPATLWLIVMLYMPFRAGRKAAPVLAIAGAFQLVAHVLAVQLTFFYPWFVSACALASAHLESAVEDSDPEIAHRLLRVKPART
jgi:hypothetical protein